MKADDFSFKIPIDLVKSDGNSDEMRIGGYASTPDEDRQGDEIIQKGLDIQDFVNYGYFNYDHDNEKILGTKQLTLKQLLDYFEIMYIFLFLN